MKFEKDGERVKGRRVYMEGIPIQGGKEAATKNEKTQDE